MQSLSDHSRLGPALESAPSRAWSLWRTGPRIDAFFPANFCTALATLSSPVTRLALSSPSSHPRHPWRRQMLPLRLGSPPATRLCGTGAWLRQSWSLTRSTAVVCASFPSGWTVRGAILEDYVGRWLGAGLRAKKRVEDASLGSFAVDLSSWPGLPLRSISFESHREAATSQLRLRLPNTI